MSRFRVNPGLLPRKVIVPRSKSHANRALVLASLKSEIVDIHHLPDSDDVTNLIKSLKKVGILIEGTSSLKVLNSFPACEVSTAPVEIDVGDGGTTARFLAGMLLLGKRSYTLVLANSLMVRPWQEFINIATELGAKAQLNGNRLHIQGPIEVFQDLKVDCTRTSQFASSLHMALSTLGKSVIPVNLKASTSYWMATHNLLEHFKSSGTYEVPMDWSSASYALAFGALKQGIFFPGLHYDPLQADAKFYPLLQKMGAISETPLGINVHPLAKNILVDMDVSDCLDLVPTLAFFLSHIDGKHRMRNVDNLIHKESNRLEGILELLQSFGKSAVKEGADLIIHGIHDFSASWSDLNLASDHRMVMIAALFCRAHSGGEVSPSEAVNKSYPQFFELFNF